IKLENGTTGSIKLDSLASLSVAASQDGGTGGKIEILAAGGTIFLASGTLSADAGAGGDSVGGEISLQAGKFSFTGVGPVTLSANGAGSGAGGSVKLQTNSAGADVTLGSAANQFTISVTGGSPGSEAGNGGKIEITAAGKIT